MKKGPYIDENDPSPLKRALYQWKGSDLMRKGPDFLKKDSESLEKVICQWQFFYLKWEAKHLSFSILLKKTKSQNLILCFWTILAFQ